MLIAAAARRAVHSELNCSLRLHAAMQSGARHGGLCNSLLSWGLQALCHWRCPIPLTLPTWCSDYNSPLRAPAGVLPLLQLARHRVDIGYATLCNQLPARTVCSPYSRCPSHVYMGTVLAYLRKCTVQRLKRCISILCYMMIFIYHAKTYPEPHPQGKLQRPSRDLCAACVCVVVTTSGVRASGRVAGQPHACSGGGGVLQEDNNTC